MTLKYMYFNRELARRIHSFGMFTEDSKHNLYFTRDKDLAVSTLCKLFVHIFFARSVLHIYSEFSSSVIDADGDIVRCRFPTSNSTNECGKLCDGLPGSTIDTVCVCSLTSLL